MNTSSNWSTESRLTVPPVRSFARHVWTIENFSRCWETEAGSDLFLRSSIFRGSDGEEWDFKLWPNGKHNPDCVSIDLWCKAWWCNGWSNFHSKLSGQDVEVNYQFSILNASQVPVYKYSFSLWPKIAKNNCQEFILKKYLMENRSSLLPNDSLTILCEIKTSIHKSFEVPESTIIDHWKSMLESQKFGDVIIETDGKEFLVYRGILQMRSPVFAAMFEHSFEEQKTNRIVIEDVKHEVVQEMLTYIYTDRAPNLKDMASDLLIVADKYDLERLKVMCEDVLCEELTKENAIDMLMFADTCSAALLKKHVINFMAVNGSHFLEKFTRKSAIARLVAANRPNLRVEVAKVMSTVWYNEAYLFDDDRSEATFTFRKRNFSKIKGAVLSPPCMIRNLPWKIMVTQTTSNAQKILGFSLHCNGESESSFWSCHAYAELVILSQKEGVHNFVKKLLHKFYQKEYVSGFHHFLDWNDVMDPEKGFIKDDTVIFQARVTADVPFGHGTIGIAFGRTK